MCDHDEAALLTEAIKGVPKEQQPPLAEGASPLHAPLAAGWPELALQVLTPLETFSVATKARTLLRTQAYNMQMCARRSQCALSRYLEVWASRQIRSQPAGAEIPERLAAIAYCAYGACVFVCLPVRDRLLVVCVTAHGAALQSAQTRCSTRRRLR